MVEQLTRLNMSANSIAEAFFDAGSAINAINDFRDIVKDAAVYADVVGLRGELMTKVDQRKMNLDDAKNEFKERVKEFGFH